MAGGRTRRNQSSQGSSPPPTLPPSRRPRGPKASSQSVAPQSASSSSKPLLPVDRLTRLSAELHALILDHLSPSSAPDLKSLFLYSLVSKGLLPHVRLHMYRELRIDTRTNAHAMHRTLHGNEVNKSVKAITADVGACAKTSSQWIGMFFLFASP